VNYLFGQLLLVAIIWVLLGVPHKAARAGLDKDGKGGVQSLLVGLLTATACALTGGYIWLLHYSVLTNVRTPQLIAGIIFTVALLPHYYNSLARACW
jgi:hypothetical protein